MEAGLAAQATATSSGSCCGGRRARAGLPSCRFGQPVSHMRSLGIQLAGLLKGRDRVGEFPLSSTAIPVRKGVERQALGGHARGGA